MMVGDGAIVPAAQLAERERERYAQYIKAWTTFNQRFWLKEFNVC